MKTERGIIAAIYLYGLAAVAIIGGLFYVYYTIDSRGYSRGKLEVTAAWNDANRAVQAAADQERAERGRLAGEQSAKLAAAEGKARDADTRWRAARGAAARAKVPLVVADCPGPTGAVAGGSSGGAGLRLAVTLRFTDQWLREWDAAWLDQTGQPFWPDPGRTSEAAGAASTVDAEAVLANHAENASRCSSNSRAHNALIDLLEKLRAR